MILINVKESIRIRMQDVSFKFSFKEKPII